MYIDICNLSKSYFLNGREIPVLSGISFDIEDGELISMTGASGVGKSTFLHLLGTLDTPTTGSIIYDGVDVQRLPDAKVAAFRNRHIGFVFQFHHLLNEFSAEENVMMPLLMRGEKLPRAKERARDVLGFVGLSHRLSHKPGELSGGEQQRVALARALVHEPSILLADEPTGNLDEKTGQEIVELILKYNHSSGAIVFLVTHNQRISQMFKTRLELNVGGALVIKT